MVDELLRRRAIRSPEVERAFRRVRRHAFMVPPYGVATDALSSEFVYSPDPDDVYIDAATAINPAAPIRCPAPGIGGRQIEALSAGDSMRILHVESGTGYYTALLAEIVGERGSVVGITYDENLATMAMAFLAQEGYTNVTIRSGDGADGLPEAAPFDRILVGGGAADIAPAWFAQLEDEGRLVLPLCHVGPLGPRMSGGVILAVEKNFDTLVGGMSPIAVCPALEGAMAPTPEESVRLAEGLQHWFALEEFYRTDLPLCIAMKSGSRHIPDPAAVPWLMETRNTVMWVEPN